MQLVDMGEQLQVVRMAKANVDGKLLDLNEEADKGFADVMQGRPGFLLHSSFSGTGWFHGG